MRTFLLIGAAALAALPALAQAQTAAPAQFGVRAGLSRSVLDGLINQEADYRNDLHAGVFLRYRLSSRVALQPELTFARQGYRSTKPYGVLPLESTTTMTYLNVPLLLKFYVGQVFNVQAGPQVGFLLGARREGQLGWSFPPGTSEVNYITGTEDAKSEFGTDAGLVVGLGADLKNGLTFSARANYGLKDINHNAADQAFRKRIGIDGGIHTRTLEFSVGYAFGRGRK
ncbi:porin family protein [Hymenobacter persicinus]|uniref:PorT family protein n=1 Tax=Hymenobacter persicinus TaxID=2025506 RepID=A0A4Q5LCP8_9BACT|nr:porin family protein [Hymenobacter persicinus]RYU81003.1 PorT family protein [Hymenobacter persicinus]